MINTRRILKTLQNPYTKHQLYYTPKNNFWIFGKKKNEEKSAAVENVAETQNLSNNAGSNLNTTSTESIQQVQQNQQQNIQQNLQQNQQQQQLNQQQDILSQQQEQIVQQPEVIDVASKSGIELNISDSKYYNNSYISEMDLGNVMSSFSPLNDYQHIDVLTKFSHLSPWYLYEQLDQFSRTSLFYCANDLGLGLGLSIAAVSLGIKFFFMPLMTMTQINAQKMKLIEPEMKNFQAQSQALSKRGDYKGLKEAQRQFAVLRKKHGIHNWITVASLTQIPILITWFLSLRYVTTQPDLYPQLKTEGFFWFTDLSLADPYFILPVMSATLSHFNIALNPNLQSGAGGNIFSKYMGYMKYVPFLSLPIVSFFPAGLNVYWCITAATHLSIALLVRSEFMREKIFGVPKYLPGTIYERQNQKHAQKVIKTTFVAENNNKRAVAEKLAQGLTGKPLPSQENKDQQQQTQQQQTQQQQQVNKGQVNVFSNKPKQQSSENKPQGGVQVFSNKPNKKKRN